MSDRKNVLVACVVMCSFISGHNQVVFELPALPWVHTELGSAWILKLFIGFLLLL